MYLARLLCSTPLDTICTSSCNVASLHHADASGLWQVIVMCWATMFYVSRQEAVFKQRIDELNGMMITNNLPHQLRVDLRRRAYTYIYI